MNVHATNLASGTGTLAARAMILNLHISQWSGRRLDKRVTDEVNTRHGATATASRVNKLLVPAGALDPIAKIANEARAEFVKRTLPWMDGGGRIMSAETYFDMAAMISDKRAAFETAIDGFIASFPSYQAQAMRDLGTMYNPADYPSADTLRDRYEMKLTVMPVPAGEDFRVQMNDGTVARIRGEIEREVRDATNRAVSDVFTRVAEVTGRMAIKLREYKPAQGKGSRAEGVFRDSLVNNVADLIDLMPALNITGDPEIDRLASAMRKLTDISPERLRTSEQAREEQADAAQEIYDSVAGYLA